MSDQRDLVWPRGRLTVQRLGAMLGPVEFHLPDGPTVSPLHVAPWADEGGSDALPGILQRLRGEWPCVPFGAPRVLPLQGDWAELLPEGATDHPHGPSSNLNWDWLAAPDGELRLALDYPPDHPIRRVERHIRPDPDACLIHLTLIIHPRADCTLPIGLHPVFRLPYARGTVRLDVGPCQGVLTFPCQAEPGVSAFAPARQVPGLDGIPLTAGGQIDATRLPLPSATEELVQVIGASGRVRLHHDGWFAELAWDREHFPSLMLWLSNRGRQGFPWNGRHLALGVEPVCSAFDLGTTISAGQNPISTQGVPTAQVFRAGKVFSTAYSIGAHPG
ncbi:MAG: hypothetical protein V4747_02855 [Pseudomonadota bacterium]